MPGRLEKDELCPPVVSCYAVNLGESGDGQEENTSAG
ncbi:hypothetical protein BJG92_02940 [Arthrobacter sp. SO5]|nr:hypothetical protein [Arthrobacter sp. SO5]